MKYSQEFKAQVLKEVSEAKNINSVAKKHNMPDTTIHTWLKRKHVDTSKENSFCEIKQLKKENAEKDLEIAILKDILKKSYQIF